MTCQTIIDVNPLDNAQSRVIIKNRQKCRVETLIHCCLFVSKFGTVVKTVIWIQGVLAEYYHHKLKPVFLDLDMYNLECPVQIYPSN